VLTIASTCENGARPELIGNGIRVGVKSAGNGYTDVDPHSSRGLPGDSADAAGGSFRLRGDLTGEPRARAYSRLGPIGLVEMMRGAKSNYHSQENGAHARHMFVRIFGKYVFSLYLDREFGLHLGVHSNRPIPQLCGTSRRGFVGFQVYWHQRNDGMLPTASGDEPATLKLLHRRNICLAPRMAVDRLRGDCPLFAEVAAE
jgi:hypothetical protein